MSTISKQKKIYKVTNWPTYNKGLVNRGNLLIMIDFDNLHTLWYAEPEGTEGAQRIYSDHAIEICLTIGALCNLPLRQTQGCVKGIFSMMGLPHDVPDYTTLSKRGDYHSVKIKTQKKDAVVLQVDSTGLKLFGEGEWKVRKHGYTKRRSWKKLHVGIDTDGEIRSVVVTENDVHDSAVTEDLFVPEMTGFGGDGAYDTKEIYEMLLYKGLTDIRIPPRRNAKPWEGEHLRNDYIKAIEETSRKQWKESIGYHDRSHVEVTMFCYKTAFTDRLKARKDGTQETEIKVRCTLLNKMKEVAWAQYEVT